MKFNLRFFVIRTKTHFSPLPHSTHMLSSFQANQGDMLENNDFMRIDWNLFPQGLGEILNIVVRSKNRPGSGEHTGF